MKLLDQIRHSLLGRQVVVVSFTQSEEEDWDIRGMTLTLSKAQDIVLEESRELASQGQLEDWLGTHEKKPLIVGIDSPEVLTRRMEQLVGDSKEALLKTIAPQAQPEDFFLQYTTEGDHYFVSIIRQESLQRILQLIPKDNLVTNIYLSPLAKMSLAKGINRMEVALGSDLLIKLDGFVHAIEHTQAERLILPDLELEVEEVVAYACGINYFSSLDMPSDFPALEAKEELTHKLFLNRYAGYVLGGFFLILLINTFFFFEFSKKNDQLKEQNTSLITAQRTIKEYSAYVKKHQSLITGGNQTIFTQLADELGASLPSALQFTKLEIRPLYLQEDKKVDNPVMIVLEGTAENAVAYTRWIEQLKKFSWLQAIDENQYRADANSGQGVFRLSLTLKEDV